ncbi:hypothetical protein ACWCYY_34910 [Kitasatospora sp. NPDC001664]
MSNKLIAAGNSRLKKADDSKIDPAVPAALQQEAAAKELAKTTALFLDGAQNGAERSVFAGGRVLSSDDIQGTPEEQLDFVTARLAEIDSIGQRADDFVVLNKGVLLETAQQRELHKVAGNSNFAAWAGEVLDIAEKYVFELLKDAKRIRALAQLRPELREQLPQASARKVIADVITKSGAELAEAVIEEGQKQAAGAGKQRPTAAMLREIADILTDKASIPSQSGGAPDAGSAPASVLPQLLPLSKATAELHERAYKPLAPAAVKAAAEADPVALGGYLDSLEEELHRVQVRITAARKLIPVDAEVVD